MSVQKMSDKKYDSELVGWVEEPRYNEEGQLLSWSVKLKGHEMKDIMDQYLTTTNEKGQGGNAYITLFMSKGGKPCARVFNPNSEAAKERRQEKAAEQTTPKDALPF
tara:strand:+ start:4713 stop:5033 length:321 start_codon:yes stop_codon:yes gene_type:complete